MSEKQIIFLLIPVVLLIIFWSTIMQILDDAGIYTAGSIIDKRKTTAANKKAAEKAKELIVGYSIGLPGIAPPDMKGYDIFKVRNLSSVLTGLNLTIANQKIKDDYLYFAIKKTFNGSTNTANRKKSFRFFQS